MGESSAAAAYDYLKRSRLIKAEGRHEAAVKSTMAAE
jgi:hypothetical protein